MTSAKTMLELADRLDAIFDRIEVSCDWRLSSEERQEIAKAANALRASAPATGDVREAPLGWNAASNARHSVKVRDYTEKLRTSLASEIEARCNSIARKTTLYDIGLEIAELPMLQSLIDYATAALASPSAPDRAETVEQIVARVKEACAQVADIAASIRALIPDGAATQDGAQPIAFDLNDPRPIWEQALAEKKP